MPNYKISYDEVGKVPSGPVCSVCDEGGDRPELGKLVVVGEYHDGSGRKIYAHERHPSGPKQPQGTVAAAKEEENIWEFTTKFRFIAAGTGTNPTEDATVEKTFPTIATPKVKEMQRTQVPEDGNPPDTFQ